MAFYIGIKKIKSLNNCGVIYGVSAPDTHSFYIKINTDTQTVELYKDLNENISSLIDFNDSEKKIDIPWLQPKIIYAIFAKTKEIMKSKNFPDDISFCT